MTPTPTYVVAVRGQERTQYLERDPLRDRRGRAGRRAHVEAVIERVAARMEASARGLRYPAELRADLPRLLARYAPPDVARRDALTLDLFEKEPKP